jgi:uncharacterized protein with HEPN domain
MSKEPLEYLKHIHDYMGINYSIVWDVAKNKIPELFDQITKVLDE